MAGEAKTKAFNIGTATVMIGPMSDVKKLTPEKHSIGLVKNFTATSSDNYTDLTQGIRNAIVWSEKTGTDNSATMEVYEYSAANLAYALGLDGSTMLPSKIFAVATVSGANITVNAGSDDDGTTFVVDNYLSLQAKSKEDKVYVDKILAVTFNDGGIPEISTTATVNDLIAMFNSQLAPKATLEIVGGHLQLTSVSQTYINKFSTVMQDAFGFVDGVGTVTGTVAVTGATVIDTLTNVVDGADLTIEVDSTLSEIEVATTPQPVQQAQYVIELYNTIPEDMGFAAGDFARNVNMIPAGTTEAQPFFGAKVVGILPDGKTPVTLLYPKIRITAGFTVGFTTDNYSNMPFEFTPFDLVEGDPNYDEFKGQGFMIVYK